MVAEKESVPMVTVRGPDVLPVDWTAVLSDRPATPLKQLIVPLVRPSPGSLRFAREWFRRRCGTRMRGGECQAACVDGEVRLHGWV